MGSKGKVIILVAILVIGGLTVVSALGYFSTPSPEIDVTNNGCSVSNQSSSTQSALVQLGTDSDRLNVTAPAALNSCSYVYEKIVTPTNQGDTTDTTFSLSLNFSAGNVVNVSSRSGPGENITIAESGSLNGAFPFGVTSVIINSQKVTNWQMDSPQNSLTIQLPVNSSQAELELIINSTVDTVP